MALSKRQERLYTDLVDLYKPDSFTNTKIGNNDILPQNYVIAYSSVKCFRETGPEILKGQFFGRVNREDTVSLMDTLHFDQLQELNPTWIIQIKTPGDPDYGLWFMISGDNTTKNFHANKQKVYIKRVTRPTGL